MADFTLRKLGEFWYNWYNDDEKLIMKFRNHHHNGPPSYITSFDPVHLQLKRDAEDDNGNIHEHSTYQSLEQVLNFFRLISYVEKYKK